MAARAEAIQDVLHRLDARRLTIELGHFNSGELLPTRGHGNSRTESAEEHADLVEAEAGFLRAANDGELINGGDVVPPLTSNAVRRGQNLARFVIADGGCGYAGLSRDFGDGEAHISKFT